MLVVSIRPEHTTRQLTYYRWRLGHDELIRLYSVAAEGFAPDDIVVSTVRNSTRYSRRSLDELVTALDASAMAGALRTWENLAFEAGESTNARHIALAIDGGRLTLVVEGEDATWVFGQTARLEMLLAAARGDSRPEGPSRRDRGSLIALWVAVTPVLTLGLGGLIGWLIAAHCIWVVWRQFIRGRAAHLHATEPLPPYGVRQRLAMAGWYDVLTLALSAVAILVAALK
ncbi:hypothetical protein [Streptomyces sp. cg40]|uniref:hypothetical protein n=1 Tax=Streptomyces sp. cg40 TaxID=3419764 RepID=UPI003D06D268